MEPIQPVGELARRAAGRPAAGAPSLSDSQMQVLEGDEQLHEALSLRPPQAGSVATKSGKRKMRRLLSRSNSRCSKSFRLLLRSTV